MDSYADRFGLKKHIYFHHLVRKVSPVGENKWQMVVEDVRNRKNKTGTYDAVFVCTGIASKKYIPTIEGANTYEGNRMHSRNYRRPETFSGLYHI